MGTRKENNEMIFSLNETAKPKLDPSQIRIDCSKQNVDAGLPKPIRALKVGRSGKIRMVICEERAFMA